RAHGEFLTSELTAHSVSQHRVRPAVRACLQTTDRDGQLPTLVKKPSQGTIGYSWAIGHRKAHSLPRRGFQTGSRRHRPDLLGGAAVVDQDGVARLEAGVAGEHGQD